MPTDAGPTLPPDVRQALRKPEHAFGRYILIKELGRGGMGSVHKAWQLDLRRYVAIKFLLGAQGEEELKRFYREAQTAAQVTHPNIAAIYEVGVQDGKHFIAMEFIDGRTMDKLPRPEDRASLLRAAKALRDAARAVDFAHSKGIIHRDLKPANIMVTKSGKVYVTDFGLAKQVKGDVKITGTGLIVGTPPFMSPEQAQGDTKRLDRFTDIWSLGATLYAAVAGRPPFEARGALATLHKVVNDDPPPSTRFNPAVPRELDAICRKALEKSKSRRYRTAGEFADDLDRLLNGAPVQAKPPTPSAMFWRWMKRRRATVGIAAASLIAGVLLIVLLSRPTPPPSPPERKTLSPEDEQRISFVQQFVTELPARMTQERLTIRDVDGQIVKAIGTLDELLKRNGETAPVHYLKGRLLHLKGEHRKALHAYDACLRIERDHVLGLYYRARLSTTLLLMEGVELQEKGILDDWLSRAASDAERAQRISGGLLKDADTNLVRAFVLSIRGEDEPALRLCLENPRQEDFLILAAMILSRRHDYGKARERMEEAIGLRPWYYEAWVCKGNLLLQQYRNGTVKSQEVLEACDQAIRNNPGYATAYQLRASVYHTLENFDKMLQDADRAVELEPEAVYLRGDRAIALGGLGRLAEAEREIQAMIREVPERHIPYYDLGLIYGRAGKFDEAIEAFGRAVAKRPTFAPAYVNRATAYLNKNDAIHAFEDAKKAADLDPTESRPCFLAARAYMKLEQAPEALEWLDRAIRLCGTIAEYYDDRADCLEFLKQFDKAIADLRKEIEIDPRLEPKLAPRIRKLEEQLREKH